MLVCAFVCRLIPQIVESVDPLVVAMLVNAVYFKGSWQTPFDPARTTHHGEFTKSSGEVLKCDVSPFELPKTRKSKLLNFFQTFRGPRSKKSDSVPVGELLFASCSLYLC